ncbi:MULTISPECIES: ABC transporter permease [unclassified Spirosoma]|uniref:ABC transporter permease n=1 Tax=unclassified Spirosoma TaxID=2621999 RepID=UPI00095A6B17|nr:MULTISPECIES: ABC transporter permease [unclassified Spirosoma]MBN8823331.1 ABC transporter permease [Spirosoma sp.]OJW72529.1 MAG: hypothetical protein BGO59_15510 [Spirosoma sp. 48-14]
MLQNYLKIALRNLRQRRFYALVTLLGLTVGITFLLLIGNYIQGELAVNKTLRNVNQQYLIQSRWKEPTMGMDITSLGLLGPTLKQQYPGLIANYYRFYGVTAIVSQGENHFREGIEIGDSTLLSIFGFPLLYGDPKTAMLAPNSIVLTEDMAQKLFGRPDVLRQTLTVQTPLGGKQVFTVTGVLQEPPRNSVLDLLPKRDQIFIPMRDVGYFTPKAGIDSWQNQYIPTYLELQPGVTADQLTKPLADLLATHAPPEYRKNLQAYLSPLSTLYLKVNNGLVEKMLLTLSLIGVFILLMAVVNFINITIGMSATRLREIGVRKALGGIKGQLIGQFLTESLLLTIGATILALGCHEIFRPTFASILERSMPSLISWSPIAYVGLLGLVLLIALLAGSYPAFILSNLPSVDSLKGKLAASVQNGIGMRRALIVFQFTVAILVFVGAVVVDRQVTYFFRKDLGYAKDHMLTVASVPRDWSPAGVQRMEGIRNQLLNVPGVSDVSFSFEIPDGGSSGRVSLFAQGQDSTQAITANTITADDHYAHTYGLSLKAGQFFTAAGGGYDSLAVVVSEATTKALGWKHPEEALGKQVMLRGGTFRVRGVLADFHFSSLHESIQPIVVIPVQKDPIYRYFSFRLKPGSVDHLHETVETIQKEWSRFFPDAPFEYSFMNNTLQKLYQTEIQLQKASRLATTLALIIVLLGVLGLVSLNVTRRTKEIGIRKVLGANTIGIVNLFIKEFALILVIANLIAWPLAYYLLHDWLTHFAYRIDLSWAPFVFVAAILALLTSLVVSTQAIRAALANPINSLRSE